MILLIDNYDSFTYNLYQYLCELGARVIVRRNDVLAVADVAGFRPRAIVISPGPGHPDQAGICVDLIRVLAPSIPILGVCLGHQAVARAFGGRVVRARRLCHGKTSEVSHDGHRIYRRVANPFLATRYHSLVVERATLPSCLAVTATSRDGTVMGIRHKRYRVEGVQFHPESVLTADGKTLLRNFLET